MWLRRADLAPRERDPLDRAINRHLVEYVQSHEPMVIAAYMAFDGEPGLTQALTELSTAGNTVALPVVVDAPGKAVIEFKRWTAECVMSENRYGIAEPQGAAEVLVTDLDLVLVPLVAWDGRGGRLGMGASFYDRLFQPFAGLTRPVRMGVGYQLQKVEKIPLDPWDVRLHAVLSEHGCEFFEETN